MKALCRILLFLSAFVLSAGLPGCGTKRSSGSGASVEGKVTFNKAPLPGGRITFHPAGGKPVFTVDIGPDGSFSNPDVEPMGEVTVTIENKNLKNLANSGDPTKMKGTAGGPKLVGLMRHRKR